MSAESEAYRDEIDELVDDNERLEQQLMELQTENERLRTLLSKCATVIKSLGCEPSIEVKDALGGDK